MVSQLESSLSACFDSTIIYLEYREQIPLTKRCKIVGSRCIKWIVATGILPSKFCRIRNSVKEIEDR